MSYPKGATAHIGAYFGQASVSVHFNNLACNGNEDNVLQCDLSGGVSCNHRLDIGIQCPGKHCPVIIM